ncbi:MAG: protein kinase [Piscinibacter sp.]
MDASTLQRLVRLSPQLDELLELDAAAQRDYLERLRARDAVTADELAALLAQQADIEREAFLEDSPLELSGATLSGQQLGAYTLERPLGAGGMGSVWLARRSDGRFEGEVAVKLLNLALLARGGAGRFAREAQALARLDHPNIARLLDAGVSAVGQPYLVLERIDGSPITRWCDERALGVEARLRLLGEVLAAVSHAHQRLVLHRDLKPDNILVTPEGRVKLLDFGIAKLIDDESMPAPPTALTEFAGRAFTPDYAAPEQVQGGEVTTATDVYALGVLLHELLGGGHPTAREGDTPVQRLHAIVEREPRRLSAAVADPARARALRGDLDNIVAKALKKSPAERYPSVAALAEDLRRHLAHEPVSARADGWAYRAGRFVRRHRGAVAALTATLAALIAGVVGTAWQAVEARRERDEALYQARRAQAHSDLSRMALETTGAADQPVTRREVLLRSFELVEKRFGADPRVAVSLLFPIAGRFAAMGDGEMDQRVMQHAEKIALASGDPQLIGHVSCNLVDTELDRGRPQLAREQARRGREALARVERPPIGSRIDCLRAEADLAQADGDLPRAIERFAAAATLVEAEGQLDGGLYGSIVMHGAVLRAEAGQFADAYTMQRWLAETNRRVGRVDALLDLQNRRGMALTLTGWGELDEAHTLLEGVAARLRDDAAGTLLPAWLELPRARLLARRGDADGAAQRLRALAETARQRASLRNALAAEVALLEVWVGARRWDEAQALLARLETETLRPPWRSTPATLRAAIALGHGREAEARATITAELKRLGHPQAAPSPALLQALQVAVRAERAGGDTARAGMLAQQALEMAQRLARDPARSADVAEARKLVAGG